MLDEFRLNFNFFSLITLIIDEINTITITYRKYDRIYVHIICGIEATRHGGQQPM